MKRIAVVLVLIILLIATIAHANYVSNYGEPRKVFCTTPKGWITYKTLTMPIASSGTFRFETLEGKRIVSTLCHSE